MNSTPLLLRGAAEEARKRHTDMDPVIFQAIVRWYNRRENGTQAMVLHADGSMS